MILICSKEENTRCLTSGVRGAGNTKLTDVGVLKIIRGYPEPHQFGIENGVTLEIEVNVTEKSAEEVATVVFEATRATELSV